MKYQSIRPYGRGESKVYDYSTGKTNQVENWLVKRAAEKCITVAEYIKYH